MAREPLRSYQNQLMNYGIGRAFADNKPVTRGQMALAELPEDPTTYLDNLKRLKMAGGISRVDELVPNDIFEATEAVTGAGGITPSSSYMQMDYGTGRFAPDGTPLGEPGTKIIPEGPKMPVPLGASDEAIAQSMIAKKEENKMSAEEFRANEAKIADMQGMPTGDPVETAFIAGIDEFIKASRGAGPDAPKPKTIEEYKEIFSDATGLDVSGAVDKSQALMSFGLALMQNRAGKNFNVGKILSAVGKAGEAALPALEKAKASAKQAALAGGKFALEMQSADEAKRAAASEKAMERSDYFIVPKGGGISGTASAILNDKGRLEKLSKYEINQLLNNPEFAKNYDILDGAAYTEILSEVMKTPEAEELYDTKTPRKIELFGEGAGDLFTIEIWRALPNANVDGKLSGTGTDTYQALARAARDINKAKEQFITGMDLAEGVNIFRFGVDKLDSLASTLGFNMREGLTPTQQLKFILDKLQAQNAPAILGEAGKTISDADRARVAQIVGDLNAGSTADEITFKLNQLFNDIIIKKERDILNALQTLDRYTGKNVSGMLSPSQELSEEDEAERVEGLKSLGIEV